ncbi:DarT ssDNA thymidine ADP-ribosyltransferase family protein [Winogradskyella sp. MH6]|uniref:DarT ssDNA thymidine ADP-ribosyltransferase family protein n=1 Tax=Winogradskyella sp. MH6 TaxID=2929510 RepID=UPI001FB26824|nr:DarT ssDNA thymidine ADP-ribosyltransferase family protein [Winogradskyella sp. MH6]
MEIPDEYKGKYFYHFTHIENLESILENGFLSTNQKEALKLNHINVASENIQTRRSSMDVTCAPNGKVHDYVPFYLSSTNPMVLAVVNGKNVDQIDLIFFAIPIKKLTEESVVYTNASANTIIPPDFFNNPKDLDQLNWEAIDSRKWSNKDDDWKHERMAEVLVNGSVPIDWIEKVIVWNKYRKDRVIKTFENYGLNAPEIKYSLNGRHFYYTKFAIGRENETLVTGPKHLKSLLIDVIKKIKSNRETNHEYSYDSLKDLLFAIKEDFCVIPELKGIYELETINDVHENNVSDHTLKVVKNLKKNQYYKDLNKRRKKIVKLAAYLHDIGKGPKKKWRDGKQPAYPDHPVDSLLMLQRILSEDIKDIKNSEIKIICKLVGYHDLLGDIVGKGRSKSQLFSIIENEKELMMLIALSMADVQAINTFWYNDLKHAIPDIIKEVKENLA